MSFINRSKIPHHIFCYLITPTNALAPYVYTRYRYLNTTAQILPILDKYSPGLCTVFLYSGAADDALRQQGKKSISSGFAFAYGFELDNYTSANSFEFTHEWGAGANKLLQIKKDLLGWVKGFVGTDLTISQAMTDVIRGVVSFMTGGASFVEELASHLSNARLILANTAQVFPEEDIKAYQGLNIEEVSYSVSKTYVTLSSDQQVTALSQLMHDLELLKIYPRVLKEVEIGSCPIAEAYKKAGGYATIKSQLSNDSEGIADENVAYFLALAQTVVQEALKVFIAVAAQHRISQTQVVDEQKVLYVLPLNERANNAVWEHLLNKRFKSNRKVKVTKINTMSNDVNEQDKDLSWIEKNLELEDGFFVWSRVNKILPADITVFFGAYVEKEMKEAIKEKERISFDRIRDFPGKKFYPRELIESTYQPQFVESNMKYEVKTGEGENSSVPDWLKDVSDNIEAFFRENLSLILSGVAAASAVGAITGVTAYVLEKFNVLAASVNFQNAYCVGLGYLNNTLGLLPVSCPTATGLYSDEDIDNFYTAVFHSVMAGAPFLAINKQEAYKLAETYKYEETISNAKETLKRITQLQIKESRPEADVSNYGINDPTTLSGATNLMSFFQMLFVVPPGDYYYIPYFKQLVYALFVGAPYVYINGAKFYISYYGIILHNMRRYALDGRESDSIYYLLPESVEVSVSENFVYPIHASITGVKGLPLWAKLKIVFRPISKWIHLYGNYLGMSKLLKYLGSLETEDGELSANNQGVSFTPSSGSSSGSSSGGICSDATDKICVHTTKNMQRRLIRQVDETLALQLQNERSRCIGHRAY